MTRTSLPRLALVAFLCLPGSESIAGDPSLAANFEHPPGTPVATVPSGVTVTFTWAVSDAPSLGHCNFSGIPGLTFGTLQGSHAFTASAGLAALVECYSDFPEQLDWGVSTQIFLTVGGSLPPGPIVTASFLPATVQRGNFSNFNWSSTNATGCVTPENPATTETEGFFPVQVTANRTLAITCTGPGGSATASATVTALPVGRPQVVIFGGTGGTRLRSGPGGVGEVVWFGLPNNRLYPGWNTYLRQFMELKDDPGRSDPNFVVPTSGYGVSIGPYARDDDGLESTACVTNTVAGLCLMTNLAEMAEYLRGRGFDVTSIPYDWRQAWSMHYADIRDAVDSAFARGMGEKIYAVGHSQGTLLLKSFLTDNPEYREKFGVLFNIGAPLGGTPASTECNTPFTGGCNFGLGGFPTFLSRETGLRLGGYNPAAYHMNPSRRLLEIIRHNTGHWMFEQHRVDANGNVTRIAPAEDNVDAAHAFMRSLAISPALFDRAVEAQERLANTWHGVPSYQIINPGSQQAAIWSERQYDRVCGQGQCVSYAGMNRMQIPSDGTAPTASSLAAFAGGPSFGTLYVNNTSHLDLVKSFYTHWFIERAIRLDRGGVDDAFGGDFPLHTDGETLALIGWSFPSTPGERASPSSAQPLTLAANGVFEVVTPKLETRMEVFVRNLTRGTRHDYSLSKAGVALLNPRVPTGNEMDAEPEEAVRPVVFATSDRIFRSGLEDDDGGTPMATDALSVDLASLTAQVALDSDDYEVELRVDRPISALARSYQTGSSISSVRVAALPSLGAGSALRFIRDASTGSIGSLSIRVDGQWVSVPMPAE